MGLAGTSLAAAIPGAVLTYVLLMAVLKSLEPMPMLLKVAALLMLVISLAMALFPAYILIWYRRDKVSLAQKGSRGGAVAAEAEGASEFAEDLVGQEFIDEETQAQPDDEWNAEDDLEMGDDGLTGEYQAVEAGSSGEEGSGVLLPDSGIIGADDGILSGIDQGEEEALGGEEHGLEETAFEESAAEHPIAIEDSTAEEEDGTGQTLQDTDALESEEEYSPAADIGEISFEEGSSTEVTAFELPEEEEAEKADEADEFSELAVEEDFPAAVDFEDEFTFEDFDEEDENDHEKK